MSTLDILLARKEEIKAILEKYGASNLRVYGVAHNDDTEGAINFLADIPAGTLHSRVVLIEDLTKDIEDLLGKQVSVNDLLIGAMWDQVNAAVLIC